MLNELLALFKKWVLRTFVVAFTAAVAFKIGFLVADWATLRLQAAFPTATSTPNTETTVLNNVASL